MGLKEEKELLIAQYTHTIKNSDIMAEQIEAARNLISTHSKYKTLKAKLSLESLVNEPIHFIVIDEIQTYLDSL